MDKKITIGLFIGSYFPMIDGVTMVVDNYAKRLVEYANVIVFTSYIPGKKCDDSKFPYKVVRCKSVKVPSTDYALPFPRLSRKFMKELKKSNLDIVHIHSPFTVGLEGVRYAKKHKIPAIGTMHTQFKLDFDRVLKFKIIINFLTKLIINVFNKCDECWAVNSEVANIYYKEYGYKELPKVMNNATDMYPVKDLEKSKDEINKLHNIKKDEKVFLFVGRINYLKNIYFIVESLKILKEKSNLKFKMLFVGTGPDVEELEKRIRENNLENEVIMCGRVTDRDLLASYYARADLFLFPSLYDASSIVQIEAASQKTPTLFIEGSATTATITDNVNGFLSENNKEKYADKIIEIMNNQELYKTVCENAFKQVYKNWDDEIKEVLEKYNEFIKK